MYTQTTNRINFIVVDSLLVVYFDYGRAMSSTDCAPHMYKLNAELFGHVHANNIWLS